MARYPETAALLRRDAQYHPCGRQGETAVGLKIEIQEIREIHEIHQNLRNPVPINRNPPSATKSTYAKTNYRNPR